MFGTDKLIPSKLTSIFFAVNRPNIIGSDKGTVVQFDAFVSETHSVEAMTTDYPIETGEQIADHIVHQPRELTIRAIAGTTPIQLYGGLGNAGEMVTNIIKNPFRDESKILNRAGRAWNDLIAQLRVGVPVSITTLLGHYDSMTIVSLVATSDEETGRDLYVDIGLKEIFYLTENGVSSSIDPVANPNMFDAFMDTIYGHIDLLEY